MANIQPQYGTATTLTVSNLTNLANGGNAISALVGNTQYLDYIITISITTQASAVSTGIVECYVQGTADGSLFDDAVNDKWIGSIAMSGTGAQTRVKTMTIASAFGGSVPPQWQLRIRNNTGGPLNSTNGGTVRYVGVNARTV